MPTAFDVRPISGLTEAEATQRLEIEGNNELPVGSQRGVLAIAIEVVREPMFLMLVACGLLYCSWASRWTRPCFWGSSSS